ncbi:putative mitochondrial carrier protein [Trypanosoma grayi]|uniref:putative mitochondrial carrier protein n=1 Tax=Trypanosoma grayi TaxID=71804 RepID=UPI0004F4BE69|nr:putative mitochondrial carrier protein [Trypanosoma grayi]KEG12360.1 putative mitochondrial carrier protein [Trypanosoma grayi]
MAAPQRSHDGQQLAAAKRVEEPVGPLVHGAAGILGGCTSTALFYPLDFLRTRMHIYKGGNTFPLRSARQIVQEEGVRGMYRGITVAMVTHSIGWGLYLTAFRAAQQRLQSIEEGVKTPLIATEGGTNSSGGSATRDFLSACFAAVVTGTIITPLNLLKTRRQLYDVKHYHKPRGFIGGVKAIVKKEGLLSLLRGVGPQILLTGSTTIQVTLYEGIKREAFKDSENPSTMEVALASALSKAAASTICNPLEVVRTRLQDKRNQPLQEYSSMGAAFRTIWRTEGMLGLYRGLPVNICRVVPTTVMAFVLYEKFLAAMVALNSVTTPLQGKPELHGVNRSTWVDTGSTD